MTNIIFDKLIIDVKSIVSKNRSSLNDDEVATLEEVVRVTLLRSLWYFQSSFPVVLKIDRMCNLVLLKSASPFFFY